MRYLQLFDFYGALLTETQRDICGQYYLYDLSLSEIAEEKNVTKQSVSDTLKKSRELLDEYEEKLGHVRRQRALTEALEAFKHSHPQLAREIDALIGVMEEK